MNKAATVIGIYVIIKIGNVKRLVKIRHFFFTWKCLYSEIVVMSARIKKTTYIEKTVITKEPTLMAISASVATKP